MSADDLRHRARPVGEHDVTGGGDLTGPHDLAARVPEEYRDAYLEGFARVRADRRDTAA